MKNVEILNLTNKLKISLKMFLYFMMKNLTSLFCYPYEFLDNWGKFKEISLPSIKHFFNNLDLKIITESDYKHAKESSRSF